MHLHVRLSLLLPRAELDQIRLSQISIRSTNRLSPPAGKRVPLTNHQASWSKALGIPSLSLTCRRRISVYLQSVSCWLLPLNPAHTQRAWGNAVQFSSGQCRKKKNLKNTKPKYKLRVVTRSYCFNPCTGNQLSELEAPDLFPFSPSPRMNNLHISLQA